MNILLVNLPWIDDTEFSALRAGSRWPHLRMKREQLPYYPFPFFMAYAAAVLKQNNHDVYLKDCVAERLNQYGFLKYLEEIKPEILVILGDRIEALAATIAAVYMNIPVAHLHGGEKSKAGIDESVRHAITKFANIHFPATQQSAERIIKMGETENHVFIVGAPCLDTILSLKTVSPAEIEKKFDLDLEKPFILVVQHPVTTELEKVESQIIETLEAIKNLQYQTIIIYPNSDAGGRIIIKHIEKNRDLPFLKIWKNMPQEDYFSLLKHASVMVGNSSSGIIESSSFKLPVVNLGIRQEGRERSNNVIDAGHDRREILAAIQKALSPDFRNNLSGINPYGDGKTGPRIAEILAGLKIDQELIQKQISY